MRLRGKTAIVTGASRGIGRAIALALAAEGASVGVNFRESSDAADEVVRSIEAEGGRAVAVRADVTDGDAAKKLVKTVADRFGGLDILINNAGILTTAPLAMLSEDAWRKVLDTDLKSAFLVSRAAIKPLRKAEWGRIVNMSSAAGLVGEAGRAHYAAAKAGLLGLTRSLAKELVAKNVTVNAVAPGPVDSDMIADMDERKRTAMLKLIPAGRFGAAEEVAAMVVYLCSHEASYVTGQTLSIDGGLCL